MSKARIGILTGGGDAPGLNSVIESAVRVLSSSGVEPVGIADGFEGIYKNQTVSLNPEIVEGLHAKAGTILGTSNKSGVVGREAEFVEKYKSLKLDGLIAIGGDGTFAGLQKVREHIPIVGVPKTIDNDLTGTEITFGYDTACSVVAESIDALKATADAHRRIILVEAMGRTTGWIALGAGLSAYADVILIPEKPFDKQALLNHLRNKQQAGQRGLIVCIAEGAKAIGEEPHVAFRVEHSPAKERLGGVSQMMARWLENELQWESRQVVLGHLQRSRPPTTTDRFLTLAMGVEAAQLALHKKWGQAVVYRQGNVVSAPIADLMQGTRHVPLDHRWIYLAQSLGIFI